MCLQTGDADERDGAKQRRMLQVCVRDKIQRKQKTTFPSDYFNVKPDMILPFDGFLCSLFVFCLLTFIRPFSSFFPRWLSSAFTLGLMPWLFFKHKYCQFVLGKNFNGLSWVKYVTCLDTINLKQPQLFGGLTKLIIAFITFHHFKNLIYAPLAACFYIAFVFFNLWTEYTVLHTHSINKTYHVNIQT